jgi:hypothetical protein
MHTQVPRSLESVHLELCVDIDIAKNLEMNRTRSEDEARAFVPLYIPVLGRLTLLSKAHFIHGLGSARFMCIRPSIWHNLISFFGSNFVIYKVMRSNFRSSCP